MHANMILKSRKSRGIKRPVLHVTMPDGRVTEFKDRGIVLPDANNAGPGGVLALLVDGDGAPYETPDGELVCLAVPVMALGVVPDPNKLISWKDMAEQAGVSLSQAKRMVTDGVLPKPTRVGLRRVAVRQGEVLAALAKLTRSATGTKV